MKMKITKKGTEKESKIKKEKKKGKKREKNIFALT
jgi:hypothetical protein